MENSTAVVCCVGFTALLLAVVIGTSAYMHMQTEMADRGYQKEVVKGYSGLVWQKVGE